MLRGKNTTSAPSGPLRVCMVAYSFYESDNRIRRYAETLALQGNYVDIVSLRQKGQSINNSLNGVSIFRIQERTINEKSKFDYLFRIMLFLFQSFWFLTIRQFKQPYHIIHVHSVPDFEVFAALIPKLFGAKIILDIHDIVPEFYAAKFHSGKTSILFHALIAVERLCCAFADHVIISNHIWGERLIKRSVAAEKCTTIINYPDLRLFTRSRPKAKSKEILLLYPGTLNWHQGLDIAIRGVAIANQQDARIRLHIYGKGPEAEALRQLVESLNLDHCVKLMGLLPSEQIVEKMQDADFGIVPKRDDDFGGDAFSTKILEFMALGVPVIIAATRIERYYFNDSIATFFTAGDHNSFAETLHNTIADKKHIETKRLSALRFIEENNWNVKKILFLEIINKLMTRKSHVE
jgi:glycosyltransferase involved in cell wall biosynthesis